MKSLIKNFQEVRKILLSVFTLLIVCISGQAQDWTLEIKNGGYGMVQCSSGQLTIQVSFAGVSKSINIFPNSSGGIIPTMHLSGTGTPSGTFEVRAHNYCGGTNGLHAEGSTQMVFNTSCNQTEYFEITDGVGGVGLPINFYNKLQITSSNSTCNDQIVLGLVCPVTTAMSASYTWEVTDNPGGGFVKVIPMTTASVTLDADDLHSTMFASGKYNTRHVRVASNVIPGIRSDWYAVDPDAAPPQVVVSKTDATCFGGEGSLTLDITPASGVTSHVVTIRRNGIQVFQQNDPSALVFPSTAGTYDILVENNTNTLEYGTCFTETKGIIITEPAQAVITDADPTPVKCKGESNGQITINSVAPGVVSDYVYMIDGAPIASNVVTGLAAKNYDIVATKAGCAPSLTLSVPVAEPEMAMTTSVSTKDYRGYGTTCATTQDGEVTATVLDNQGPVTYQWFKDGSQMTDASTPIIPGLGAGSYYVKVIDTNNCMATSNVVPVVPAPNIEFTIGQTGTIKCSGDETVTLTAVVEPLSIVGTRFYEWSPATDSEKDKTDLYNKGAGTYTLTVSDNLGCKTTKQSVISAPDPYTAVINIASDYNGKPIKCNNEGNGILAARLLDKNNVEASAVGFSWYKDGSAFESGPALNQIDELNEGLYKVEITYNDGCTVEGTKFLEDPDPVVPVITIPSTIENNGVHISCPGKSDGRLHATAIGGSETGYTFLWDSQEATPDISGKPAGTYRVTATDMNGCAGSATITLQDPAPVTPSIEIKLLYNGLPILCHDSKDGGRLEASATGGAGGYNFVWNAGDPGVGPILDNVGPGQYSVTVTDANSCPATASAIIVPPDTVSTTISVISDFRGQAIRCFNERNAHLRAVGTGGTNSFDFTWSTTSGADLAGIDLNKMDLTGIPAGKYTLMTTDLNGCGATENITIMNPEPVEAVINAFSNFSGYGLSCKDARDGFIEASGSGGTNRYTYFWSETSETSSKIEELSEGTYHVTVADENGCSNTADHAIIAPPVLSLSVTDSDNITCFDGSNGSISLSVTGGVPTYEYSLDGTTWQPQPSFSGLIAATHTPIVSDANGCESTVDHTLVQPEKIIIGFSTEPAFCADPRGAALSTVTGGVSPYTYTWTDAIDNVIGTGASIENQDAGVYTLTVHDKQGCLMAGSVGISSTDGAQANVKGIISASCSYSADGGGELEVIAGDGPFTFLWPDGQTASKGTGLAAGLYQVVITDNNDCETVFPITIPAPDPLDIVALETTPPNCHGNCDGSIRVEGKGGVGNYVYDWGTQTGAEASNLCAGSYPVVVNDGNGCEFEKTITLAQPNPLSIALVNRTIPLCHGDCNGSMEIAASGGNSQYQYSWSSGASEPRTSGICAGDYTITVTDSKNCVLQRSFVLGEPTPLQLQLLEAGIPTCFDGCDGTLNVQATGGTQSYQYEWSVAGTTPQITDLCSGDYSVLATDANGCSLSTTYSIENPPPLIIDLGGAVTLCEGQSHILDAGTHWTAYAWGSSTGISANSQAVTIKNAGQYWLEALDAAGCVARDTFLLETSLDLLEASFMIPKEALQGDTIAIIDISWPLPEISEWSFPESMQKIMDFGEVVFGQFDQAGIYQIGLTAYLGQCVDKIEKNIFILKGLDEVPDGGRLGHEEYVKDFSLHPNPTDGKFEINVELAEAGFAMISIWNSPQGYLIKEMHGEGKLKYYWPIDLRPLSSGIYVVRLDHAKGKKYLRFVVR